MRSRLTLMMLVGVVLCARAALANPIPGTEEYIGASYWFIKTIPLNYAVDLIALSVALLVTAELPAGSWKLLPLYNIPLVIAGFAADYIGASIVGLPSAVPGAVVTSRDPLIGSLLAGHVDYSLSAGEAAGLLFWTTLLIFAFNLVCIAAILRVNEANSYGRLPIAAGIMAVVTTPYLSVNKSVAWTRIVPLLMVSAAAIGFVAVRHFLASRRVR